MLRQPCQNVMRMFPVSWDEPDSLSPHNVISCWESSFIIPKGFSIKANFHWIISDSCTCFPGISIAVRSTQPSPLRMTAAPGILNSKEMTHMWIWALRSKHNSDPPWPILAGGVNGAGWRAGLLCLGYFEPVLIYFWTAEAMRMVRLSQVCRSYIYEEFRC